MFGNGNMYLNGRSQSRIRKLFGGNADLEGTFLLKRIFCIKKQLSTQSFENYKKCLILNFYANNDANSCIGHIVHYSLVKK